MPQRCSRSSSNHWPLNLLAWARKGRGWGATSTGSGNGKGGEGRGGYFYGGYDGAVWAIGHVRTRDFRTFEPNPHNPIFTPAADPQAWDSNGLLTPQVFAMNGAYYMIYAGLKGTGWNRVSAVQSGLAVARP